MRKALLIASLTFQLQSSGLQARTGQISGQILAQDGKPARGVRVMAVEAANGAAGNAMLLGGVTNTDPEGRYRIDNLRPGGYRILAGSLDTPVYFPGTAIVSGATVVNVMAGGTTAQVDFPLVATTFTISGQIVWEDGIAPVEGRVLLSEGQRQFQAPLFPNSHFEFTSVPAGVYSIGHGGPAASFVIRGARGGLSIPPIPRTTGLFLFPQTIAVAGDDTHVVLHAVRTQEVSGAVTIEGGGPPPRFELIFKGRFDVAVEVDGTFRAQVASGEYQVMPRGLPPGFTLKSVQAVGATSSGTAFPLKFTVPNSASFLNVTLAPGAPSPYGKVSGHVAGAGKNQTLSVVLTEMPGVFVRQRGTLGVVDSWKAPVDAAGNFEFPRVLPGRYRATLLSRPDSHLDISTTPAVEDIVVAGSVQGVRDVANVRFTIPPQIEIRGRIEVGGLGPIPNFSIRLTSEEHNVLDTVHIRPDRNGRFTLTLAAGSRLIDEVNGLPEDYEIRYGSTDVEEDGLDVKEKGTAELRVRVRRPESQAVRVSGRTTDLPKDVLAQGRLRATLTSPAYAGVIETTVRSDGSFAFADVSPGSYIVKISGPRVPDNTCAALTVEQTQVSDVAVGPAKEIELLSAHWDDGFATDVTKEVSSLLKPELQEFFAAPEWLLRGPLTGVKTLGIRFQFACREFVLDAWEPNPISYAILKTYAETVIAGERWNGPVYATDEDAETMQNITPVSNSDVVVVNALYGYGNDFSNVTDKVRDLLATGAPLFVVSDGMFNVTPDASDRRLLLTYLYRGKRATVQIRKMGEFSISFLAETAEAGFQAGEYFSDPDYFRPDKRFFKFQ